MKLSNTTPRYDRFRCAFIWNVVFRCSLQISKYTSYFWLLFVVAILAQVDCLFSISIFGWRWQCAQSDITSWRFKFALSEFILSLPVVQRPGLRSRSRKESYVFGWSRSRIPNNTGNRSRIFFPTPTANVRLDHFLHYTPKLGIPVEILQFLLKLLLKQISCCVPRCPLILTAKFHSLYVKESESEILESRSQIFYLRLRKHGGDSRARLAAAIGCDEAQRCNSTAFRFHSFEKVLRSKNKPIARSLLASLAEVGHCEGVRWQTSAASGVHELGQCARSVGTIPGGGRLLSVSRDSVLRVSAPSRCA